MAFRIPESCRKAFRIDIVAGGLFSLGLAYLFLTEAVLRKTLDAPRWLVIALFSLRMGSLILSPAWAGASHGRRKVPFISFGAIAAGVLLMGVAISVPGIRMLMPPSVEATGGAEASTPWYAVSPDLLVFCLLAAMAYIGASGLNVLQMSVYGQNYPVQSRAKIVSRINLRRMGLLGTVGLVMALLMDRWPMIYAPLMVLGGLAFILGGLLYRKMHVVGEEHLRASVNTAELKTRISPLASFRLMFRNPHFLRFEICQTFHGAGNLISVAAFLLVLTDELNAAYFHIVMIMLVVPPAMEALSTTLWAPVIDRMSPARARVFNSPFWVLGLLLFPLCALVPHGLVFAYLAQMSRGIAMGGSKLLWSLGPLHYADKDEPAHYLAAHNLVTGLRGLVFVAIGGLLYVTLLGKWVFVLGALLMTTALVMFYFQDRAEQRDPAFRGEADIEADNAAAAAGE
jgi:hypothetical protein